MLDDAVYENKQIYFEEEASLDIFPKPDMENFVQLQSHQDDLNQEPAELDRQLQNLVLPEVRAMQDELKGLLT